ncbi:amidohydrolase family protein [Sphingomonas sp. LY160]|uniref:amidohydrolase family protein n=1 Tax=Sphingomonas sp. LY160 TaxID=3095342 RepID=UPI002ADEE6EB|nr:amidohydrolase family protein [Sphingomonas sp. LY160]MEA1072919.1 amidohydrolase family protein [Sphingomonas sp. LY160]
MRHISLLLGCSLFAVAVPTLAAQQPTPAPTPPVAPPVPQPGQAEPIQQDVPPGIAPAPGTAGPKGPKWNVNVPHGPGRTVPIDTRKGTWMSLDVSPDGREIAFDLLGDIYTVPIGGGEARAISTGHSWDMQPRYSPDGQEIAITSDRGGGDNIWTIRRDGSAPRQITKEDFRLLNQADWSPDGSFIVARKHFTSSRSLGAGEMWLYHRSGGDKGSGVQMTKARTKQKDTNEPAFSPDGRYLYFSDDATPGDTFEYSKDPNGQIYVIQRLDRQTGTIETYVDGPGGAIRPTPSPDGKTLAFIRRVRYKSTLMTMDIASGRITPVTDILDRDMQETWAVHGVYPGMSWTPDSKSIVFWAKGGIHRVDVASRAISEIPFHVTGSRFVEDAVRQQKEVAPASFKTKMVRFATKSPDGSRIVYEALGNLWIADGNGTNPRRLTRGAEMESYPAFSRDGRQIAYVGWTDDKAARIKVVSAGGGEGRVVTSEPGHYVEPAFSPDGSMITYRKTSDGFLTTPLYGRDPGLYVVPARGGAAKRVAKSGGQPMFGAANDRIFFTASGPEGKRLLKSVSLAGTDEVTHLVSQNAARFALSPDEQYVAWTERYQAYVTPFVRSGREIEIAPEGKALPQSRLSVDAGDWIHWSGNGRTLYWSQGPNLYGQNVGASNAFAGGKQAPAPLVAQLGIVAEQVKPSGRIALTGARIVTMRGDEVIEGGTVVIEGDRIVAVGPTAAVSVPAGTRTIDVTGKTIIPGLIDAHWHGPMGSDLIVPQQNWVHAAALAYGVTTVHDPSNDTAEIFAAAEYQKAGKILGPRIFSTGTILYGATTPFTVEVNSLDDALSHLRRLQASGAWSVKSYNQPRREQRQMVIQAARQLGMEVVPEGGSLFEHNMTMIADGHTTIEHSLPVANVYDDVLQFWRGSGTAYTPTLIVAYGGAFGENWWYQKTKVWEEPILSRWVPRPLLDARSRRPVMYPDEENNLQSIANVARQVSELGVPVSIGAHGQREGLGAHWDLWSFALGGMTPLQSLKTGTINPARALGLDKDLGSVEPGKLADLVILDANPLENIRNSTSVSMTMVGGRLLDRNLQVVAGNVPGSTSGFKPFWFHEQAGGSFTAGASVGVPHQD